VESRASSTVAVTDFDDHITRHQQRDGLCQCPGKDLAQVAIGDITAGEPKDAGWWTPAQGELH